MIKSLKSKAVISLAGVMAAGLFVAGCAMGGQSSMSQMSMPDPGTTTVGGAAMYPSRNIVQNAINSKDHTILVKLVKEAGLVKALEGKGPFTVFAPTNKAFMALPASTVEALQESQNRSKLKNVLLYHVVKGRYDFDRLAAMIKQDGGKAVLKTLNGHDLTVMMNGDHNIVVKDAAGDIAHISTYDVYQSNGVIQVVNRVLMT